MENLVSFVMVNVGDTIYGATRIGNDRYRMRKYEVVDKEIEETIYGGEIVTVWVKDDDGTELDFTTLANCRVYFGWFDTSLYNAFSPSQENLDEVLRFSVVEKDFPQE